MPKVEKFKDGESNKDTHQQISELKNKLYEAINDHLEKNNGSTYSIIEGGAFSFLHLIYMDFLSRTDIPLRRKTIIKSYKQMSKAVLKSLKKEV